MTDTDVVLHDQHSSRRALLGLGGLAAIGALAGEAFALPADAAVAATSTRPAHHGKQYASASLAAKAAGSAHSSVFPHDPKAHLLRRATFGPRPSDVKSLDHLGIDEWIARQLSPSSIHDPRGDHAWKSFSLAGASPATIVKRSKPFSGDANFATANATLARQIFSDRQLFEIVVDVFANHLHVPIPGEQWHTAPSYVSQVIRKHALGRFDQMLLAAMKQPAMLNFLSNDLSRKANVNENLGRELLELHTVGRSAGYTEEMVRASAKILSGRTWDYDSGEYFFEGPWHWTGYVRVLGFTSPNKSGAGGEKVGDAYLRYLAHHPATARNIARKLAIRFVSDTPSANLVQRLADVYLAHNTSIKAVVDAIFKSSDFWDAVGDRMRRPLEDAVGALRVLDVHQASKMKDAIGSLYWGLYQSGQTPLGWPVVNGYPDVAAAWLSAGGMLQRWNMHRASVYGWWQHLPVTAPSKLVPRTKTMNTWEWTHAVAHRVLGVTPSKRHLTAVIHGAHLKAAAPAPLDDWQCGKIVALLLDSPYFQLR